MRGILKFILVVAGNALALWLAWLYVPGFVLNMKKYANLTPDFHGRLQLPGRVPGVS